jgi:hypothetical protein
MDHIINSDVFIKQPAMCMIVLILPVKEETAASLGVHIPKQNTKSAFGQETGQVNRSCGFSNASLYVIYGNLFQNLKLFTNPRSNEENDLIFAAGRAFSYL